MTNEKPWTLPMPEEQFALMRDILAAPSPVGFEGAMTFGVLQPFFERIKLPSWGFHTFQSQAGLILDTHPGRDDLFTVMLIGHADKIRLQVRSIGADGKIWVNTDSFLPMTLLGHEVVLFSEDPKKPGQYRAISGGTLEAIGAIHFANEALRTGKVGIKEEQIYLELQLHGEDRKQQVQNLGIRTGDVLILNRPIRRGFSPNTFYGAYLDNGLGCFVTAEVARLLASQGGTQTIRVLFATATHEEIGRMGSRVLANLFKPDVVIGVDVNHDYASAPGIDDRRMPPLAMGKGFTLSVGAIVSASLNAMIQDAALAHGIPCQLSVVGRDTGTDGMAGFFASIDAASTSIGFPIRNMHTISESGHTSDLLAAIHVLALFLQSLDQKTIAGLLARDHFKNHHPRLDLAAPLFATAL